MLWLLDLIRGLIDSYRKRQEERWAEEAEELKVRKEICDVKATATDAKIKVMKAQEELLTAKCGYVKSLLGEGRNSNGISANHKERKRKATAG